CERRPSPLFFQQHQCQGALTLVSGRRQGANGAREKKRLGGISCRRARFLGNGHAAGTQWSRQGKVFLGNVSRGEPRFPFVNEVIGLPLAWAVFPKVHDFSVDAVLELVWTLLSSCCVIFSRPARCWPAASNLA